MLFFLNFNIVLQYQSKTSYCTSKFGQLLISVIDLKFQTTINNLKQFFLSSLSH